MDPDIEAALASLPTPNLDDIDFDALPESPTELKPPSPYLRGCIHRLEHAADQGDLVSIQELIATVEALSHGNSIRAGRSLMLAIENSHYEVVEYLVAAGVEISFWEVQKAIEEAKASRNVRSLQLLFERWDINWEFGWSDPPALAYVVDDIELVRWFLAYGASPNASCSIGTTPLSIAVQRGLLPVVHLLLAYGGNPRQGYLLHFAVWRELERKPVIDYLVSRSAPVNAVLHHDRPEVYNIRQRFGLGTPLHAAAAVGDGESIRLLIEYGARLDIRDSCGQLPTETAEACGHKYVARFLREQAFAQGGP